ncbi:MULTISPECIES: ead/Ea22-like family protein [Citrobacter]|uniref:ead/Ea22-like family protein n=1 Tax=Citrobacter TaxID=544 RepID=UPI001373F60B|nr:MULTISPECIES: ead/Ea22-like family protein [Citrobacter]ELI8783808.1 ead/Ea22-like family protein [Citrobacter freundii]MCR3702971.1 ead/Ea22-like family protein [Citrobacter portucalensis]MDM2768947.1 ead/Ea22-like family protein [Citrobacter sp. Cpo147]MDS0995199.1 ead/Ea22-like family protein [Citrobacter freundii]MDV0582413.1 ead/Ea22-like family protein [Citrobacter braakii]
MTALNKQALRSKARSASAGEWIKESGDGWEAICSSDDQANGNFIIAHFEGPDAKANREFSQTANPATVLALLDEVEAADRLNADYRARLDRLERRCNHQGSVYWDASGVKRCAGCGIDAAGIGVKGE